LIKKFSLIGGFNATYINDNSGVVCFLLGHPMSNVCCKVSGFLPIHYTWLCVKIVKTS